jgi:polyribonucleotide nucleotidyltransferase
VRLDEPMIVVARDLSPADTAAMVREPALGFVTTVGTRTSHTSIMARALEIPAVVGVANALSQIRTGDMLIVDGLSGQVLVHPTEQAIRDARQRSEQHLAFARQLLSARHQPCVTADGIPVALKANVELPAEAILAVDHGAQGIGLYRTEFLYIDRTTQPGEDEQYVDALSGTYKEKFLLHYNFPPYSVGETGRMGGAGRREIGHGKLAWRAIRPMLPSSEDFPYTIRLVSEITESNGSSSMATVCGSSLALMDAGVPLKKPVSGIAMGLILEPSGEFAILSDILGDEDHLGDMDFKVAGTRDGITSLQMDIKVAGITEEIMKTAIAQASAGRLHILDEMDKAIDGARTELGEYAPKIESIKVPTDKIRDIIGTGGKIIREIVEKTGAKINIEDDGTVKIAASDQEKIDAAKNWISSIVSEPEPGTIYSGKVVKVVDFGAFVNFFGAKDGLVHVSQISLERVANPADVLSEGQEVKVKFLGMDDRGKTKLSMKVVDQTTGEDITDKINAERAERGEPPLSDDTGGRPKREGGGDRDRGRSRR